MDNKEKNINYFAAVVGDWHFNTLGMVRSLGEKGIPVVYINMSEGGYAESSKYTKKTYHAESDEDIINAILTAADEFNGKPVLFPGCDKAALCIDEAYDILKDRCVCPGFKGNMAQCMDKDNMCSLASSVGFNVPKSMNLKIENGFEKNLRSFPLPLIIKPLKSVDGSKADIMICRNSEQLNEAVNVLSLPDCGYKQVLVQQFVDGNSNLMVEYCGCKVPGRKVDVLGQLEKIREYPVNRGSTTYAVINEKITYIDVDILNNFLEKSGFNGIFDLELKVVDGTPYFLEINYRNGAPAYGFTGAGFNVAYTWYCSQVGLPVPESKLKKSFLMSERDDLNNVKDKNVGLLKWVKDIKNTDTMMIFNKEDPQPFADSYNKIICKVFSLLQR